ncbi:hypothetical protein JAAARDRAFT_353847 [Jaapia argillacea MUCL 33604]|uniref:Uncharacterized protein n=1 Tax=Jaapia argillacea MUCL 33604 TaxID=933084 RepID=A0A067PM31_9AGAM|nr:hypothetical protein JAAARDRAFT_353847 [Jaapia argillacea MUCL 33604]
MPLWHTLSVFLPVLPSPVSSTLAVGYNIRLLSQVISLVPDNSTWCGETSRPTEGNFIPGGSVYIAGHWMASYGGRYGIIDVTMWPYNLWRLHRNGSDRWSGR